MQNRAAIFALLGIFSLTACVKHEGQSQYNYSEVGQSSIAEFGTVIKARQVDITGRNSGAGALVGAAAGGGAGAYAGNGSGKAWAVGGGAIAGALIGAAAEQAAANRKGIEYTIVKENGKVVTLVQDINPEDKIFRKGERVMIQSSGSFQRVLPADDLPDTVKRPKGIKVVD